MLSDDVETAQTVLMMDELAERDAPTRTVISATLDALSAAGLDLDSPPEDKARAIYWYLKRRIRYVPIPGTSPLVDQTLIPPASLLAMPDPEADCPQFSMLASAMLRVCCVPSHFKTIAADPAYPDTYSHVYNVVEIENGRFLPFDSSNGPEPGAEYSSPSKSRVWPQRNRTCTSTGRKSSMVRTHTHRGFRNSALRGALGIAFLPLSGLRDTQCDDSGNCWTDGSQVTGSYDPLPVVSTPGTGVLLAPVTGPSYAPPGVQAQNDPIANAQGLANLYAGAPPPSGANAYSLATAALTDATSAAAPIIKAATQQQPYYITGPNGQAVLYNPNTGAVGTSASAALSSLSPTTLLIAALLIGGLMLSGKK